MIQFKHRGLNATPSFFCSEPWSRQRRHAQVTCNVYNNEIIFLAYCSLMRVIVILGCHVCTLWVPICSSEGHRDMATEAGKPLTPSQWWAGDAAGSHYRSPPHWLIRLILLIESHPSPTVPLWDWGQTEGLRPSHSGMPSHWTATLY